jgi:hypothetical protein
VCVVLCATLCVGCAATQQAALASPPVIKHNAPPQTPHTKQHQQQRQLPGDSRSSPRLVLLQAAGQSLKTVAAGLRSNTCSQCSIVLLLQRSEAAAAAATDQEQAAGAAAGG